MPHVSRRDWRLMRLFAFQRGSRSRMAWQAAEAGRHTLAIVAPLAHRMVTVEEEALALAMLRLAELEKCVIEGAGAAGLAAFPGGRLPELL